MAIMMAGVRCIGATKIFLGANIEFMTLLPQWATQKKTSGLKKKQFCFFLHIFVMFRVRRIILTKNYSQGSSWNALPRTKKNEEGERGRRRAVCARIQEVRAAAAAQQ